MLKFTHSIYQKKIPHIEIDDFVCGQQRENRKNNNENTDDKRNGIFSEIVVNTNTQQGK